MRGLVLFVFLGIHFFLQDIYAYRWPNDEIKIVRHFGQKVVTGANRSLDLLGDFEEVFPVSAGEILFEHGADQDLFPTKAAKTVIMGHNDGINVVYSGLENIVAEPFKKISEAQVLGLRLPNEPLSIAFYDYQVSQYVNPLVFLPEQKFNGQDVILAAIYLRSQDGSEFLIRQNTVVPAGTYEVLADASEFINGISLSPYQIELDFMGDIIAQITMDALTASDGKGILKGKKVYQEASLYDNAGRFQLGRLTLIPGQSFITIRLSSINSLRKQEQFRLITTRN